MSQPSKCPCCGTPKKLTTIQHSPYDHDWDRKIEFGCGSVVYRLTTMTTDDEGHRKRCEPYWSEVRDRPTSCFYVQVRVLETQVANLKAATIPR